MNKSVTTRPPSLPGWISRCLYFRYFRNLALEAGACDRPHPLASFTPQGTAQQVPDRVLRQLAGVQHFRDLRADGQVHTQRMREIRSAARGRHTFGDMPERGQYFGERLAAPELEAHGAVARHVAGAGQ